MRYISPYGFGIADTHFIGVLNPAPLVGPSWVAVTPPSLGSLTIVQNGGTLYIGDDSGNLFTSIDGGLHWAFDSNSGSAGNNKITLGGGALMMPGVIGSTDNAERTTNFGGAWSPINTFSLVDWIAGAGGLWSGWGVDPGSGNPINGFSTDDGATWTLLGTGGLPSGRGINSLAGFYSSSGVFVDIEDTANQVATSTDAHTWTLVAGLFLSALIEVNLVYIGGGIDYVVSAASIAGLGGATHIPIPYPVSDAVVGIAGSAVKNFYVALSLFGQVTTAPTPTGPWLIGTLNFQVGDTVNQVLWDPLHQNFVAVGAAGSVSVLHIP